MVLYGPPHLPFLYFCWYLRGFVTDLHGWSSAVVSRGSTIYIYVCMSVCMSVCMYVCMYVWMYEWMNEWMNEWISVYIYITGWWF